MAEEDESEGEEDGWVDYYFGDREGFEGRHCGGGFGVLVWGFGERSTPRICIAYHGAFERQL